MQQEWVKQLFNQCFFTVSKNNLCMLIRWSVARKFLLSQVGLSSHQRLQTDCKIVGDDLNC